jgi:hypothetical protein
MDKPMIKAKISIITSGEAILTTLNGKKLHDWFSSEQEAIDYANKNNILLPPWRKKTWLKKNLEKHPEVLPFRNEDGVLVSPGGFWPDGRRIIRPDLREEGEDKPLTYFVKEHQRVVSTTTQLVTPALELELIYKIARRAIVLSPALREKNDVLKVASAIEVCHVLYHRLRLAEMAETNDGASLLHDVWLILRSINHEKSKWDNVISPKFAEGDSEQGAQP